MQTLIINPDTKQPVTIDDWRKDLNPTRANLVLLDLDGYKLLMAKNHSEKEYNWQDATNYAAEFTADGFSDFRLQTRKESVDIYNCRFIGQLDEALNLIGGNTNRGWSWGCERDTDPDYSDQCAWVFYGNYGSSIGVNFYRGYLAVPVALYPSNVSPEAIAPETPLVQMTAGQLAEYLKTQAPAAASAATSTPEDPGQGRRYVYGLKGIMQLFNVSETTAWEYKKGLIKDAVTQYGRKIVVDADRALELYRAAKYPWLQ